MKLATVVIAGMLAAFLIHWIAGKKAAPAPPLLITSGVVMPDACVPERGKTLHYSHTFTAAGGKAPYVWVFIPLDDMEKARPSASGLYERNVYSWEAGKDQSVLARVLDAKGDSCEQVVSFKIKQCEELR